MRPIHVRQGQEELPVGLFLFAQWRLRCHIDGFPARLSLVFDRTGLDAETTTRTIFRGDLKGIFHPGKLFETRLCRLEGCGRALQEIWAIDFLTDNNVWADHHALATLNADIRIPDRQF